MLKGKNAIITGARRGIGRATVECFAKYGANIWACARKPDEDFEADMAGLAKTYGVWIRPVYFDLTDDEQMKAAVKGIREQKASIDVLVNVAGVLYDALLPMISKEKARTLMDVNFFGSLSLTQLVSRMMMRQRKGSIVNIASYLGIDGNAGQTVYSASKAAVINMTKSLAKELSAYGIRVNAIAPGVVQTDMTGNLSQDTMEQLVARSYLHRAAQPVEIANAIAFLASDIASYITAQTLRVDGGM